MMMRFNGRCVQFMMRFNGRGVQFTNDRNGNWECILDHSRMSRLVACGFKLCCLVNFAADGTAVHYSLLALLFKGAQQPNRLEECVRTYAR
jgi:hypothetical protein